MPRPNILFIMADDMGYGDVGCYNPQSKIPTPNMDRLAREGVRFSDAHSPAAVCTPTRYGVLTGRYCWRSPLKRSVLFGYEEPLIEAQRLTAASMLKSIGYHTACIGKWHLGLGYSPKPSADLELNRPLPWTDAEYEFEQRIDFEQPLSGGPNDLGFDYFYGTSGCPTCQPPYGFIEDRHFVELPSQYHAYPEFTSRPGMMAPGWRHEDADPEFARAAVAYIESQARADEPFFLYLCSDAPHEPCEESVVPEFARNKSQAGPRGDLVWLFDWMVGEVMDALERSGLADETLIIVTSDNGALPGDRTGPVSYNTYGHRSCGSWRGYKAHIWEGGHREPLIARWPDHIAPHTTSDALVCLTDFVATWAAICGYELPDDTAEDSIDLYPLLRGEEPDQPLRTDMVHHSSNGVFSLRQGKWKCIFETMGSGGWPPPVGGSPVPGAPGQLYNLYQDPGEEHNLWNTHPEIVADLNALLQSYKDDGRSTTKRPS